MPTIWFFAGQTSPDGPIRRVEVVNTPLVIGRREDVGLTLPCSSVSGRHAEIFEHEDGLWVRDLSSTNGTYVNGKQVEAPMELQENDILQFATVVFRVGRDDVESNDKATVCQDACDQALSLMQFDRLIEGNAVVPYFQPIVRLDDDEFVLEAYEVLARSRLIGLSTPREMFETAAQLNLETELSRIMRSAGLQQARQFDDSTTIYVNTHPSELKDEEMYDSLREVRAQHPTMNITLEIHEASITDPGAVRELRMVLDDLGMGLAFDDFGAGQARLVELSEVAPDCLKFDMKLVQGIHSAPAGRQRVVESLIKMVNELGVASLVEGVETREDHETLVQMGAKLGQGFYYGRPCSIDEIVAK